MVILHLLQEAWNVGKWTLVEVDTMVNYVIAPVHVYELFYLNCSMPGGGGVLRYISDGDVRSPFFNHHLFALILKSIFFRVQHVVRRGDLKEPPGFLGLKFAI